MSATNANARLFSTHGWKINTITLIICVLMLFLFNACNGSKNTNSTSNTSAPSSSSSPAQGQSSANNQTIDIATDKNDQWAINVVQSLNLAQKAAMLGPTGNGFEGLGPASIPKLGYFESEGGANNGGTPLLSPLGLAATWDLNLAYDLGKRLGNEAYAAGGAVGMGIGMNIARDPRNGRSYEYFGEDPLLAGLMAVQHIKGVQSNPILESAKHYVNNDQETGRHTVNVIVDERTQHQIYLLPFEMAVTQAQPGQVMCSYNSVNGHYACENKAILTDILKNMWGFDGHVITDARDATSRDALAMSAGVDVDWADWVANSSNIQRAMAGVTSAVSNGALSPLRLDDAKRRELRTLARIKDAYPYRESIDYVAGYADSQRFAENAIVLLKNAGSTPLLPLDPATQQTIAVIGGHADQYVLWGGGSAGMTDPTGEPSNPPSLGGVSASSWNSAHWLKSSPLKAIQAIAPKAKVQFTDYTGSSSIPAAVSAASVADVVVVFALQHSSEAMDTQLNLSDGQDDLIRAVAATGKPTVVVVESGTVIAMPWINIVTAVMETWYPGIRGGEAIANVLFGKANPSGKLPITFPVDTSQLINPTIAGSGDIHYSEGLNVGYRWYDSQNLVPLFPFGFGLSYTTFHYGNPSSQILSDGSISLSFDLTNTGKRDGQEVAQVYAQLPAAASEPPQRLVGWQKVALKAGQSQSVNIVIDPDRLRIWDSTPHHWAFMPGLYTFQISASSRDPRLTQSLTLAQPAAKAPTVTALRPPMTSFAGVKQTYTILGSGLDGVNVRATLGGLPCVERSQRYDRIFRAWCQAPATAGAATLSVFDQDKEIARQVINIVATPQTPGGYLRVDETGEPMAAYNNASYAGSADSQDTCVLQTRDQQQKPLTQNLLWEVKRNDGGLRDVKKLYTNLLNDSSATNTLGYVNAVNDQQEGQGMCGSNQWRLPTLSELQGIVSGAANPSLVFIDANFFPNSYKWGHWTTTPGADNLHTISVVFSSVNNTFQSPRAEQQTAIRLVSQP